ncbi:MAG: transglutaminase domain-containing protein [Planctomycetes bacterium]|nr:transglutaminase domain-containing protein [Planctomycetota bacterium]
MSEAAQPLEARADWLAYALVACVLGALVRAAGDGQFAVQLPLFVLLAGLVFTRGRLRVSLGPVSVVLLLAPLALLMNLVEVKGRGGNQFLRSFYLTYAVLELALLQLWARPSPYARGRVIYLTAAGMLFVSVGLPDYIGMLPGWRETGIMAALGRRALTPHTFYAASAAVWGLLTLVALRPPRSGVGAPGARGRAAAWLVCAALALGLAGGGTWAFRAYYAELSEIYYRLVGGATPGLGGGFSDRGDLGSVLDLQGKDGGRELALRAVSDTAPGYLRGRAFLSYAGGSWQPGPDVVLPLSASGRLLRPETEPPAPGDPDLWVYPASAHAGVVFAPLHAGQVRLLAEAARVLPGWCLRPYQGETSSGVSITYARSPWHYESEREGYRALPEDPALLAALDATWAKITAASPDAARDYDARVAALRAFFERTYTYRFGITFRGEQDPVTEFLLEKEHGHCELFASAGALLLRRAGIPARYTTGFLCLEASPIRERLWVARNRSAHAWIEAYHPQRGWEVVEFTPAGGLPAVDPPGTGAALSEALGAWVSEVWGALRGRLSELPGRLLTTLKGLLGWVSGSPWRWGPLALLAVALVALRLWRRRGPRVRVARASGAVRLPPELQALRERYLGLEVALRRAGAPRGPGETIRELRARLAEAEWPLPEHEREPTLAFLAAYAVERYRAYPEDA